MVIEVKFKDSDKEFKYNSFDELLKLENYHDIVYLNCSCNNLTSLPSSLPPTLKILYCYCNNLTSLPLSLLFCRDLGEIYFYGNEIELTLPQIRFIERIRSFIERIRNRANFNNGSVYGDRQNVHNSAVQKSLLESINVLFRK